MTPQRFYLFLGLSLGLLRTAFAAGDLIWSKTEISVNAPLDAETVESVFRFKNAGKKPVTILSVSTSCGCTAATPSKKIYEPGEEGEIKTVFTVGGRSGPQEKTIEIESSDSPDTPATLVLKVSVPESFTLEPRFLLWAAGEKTPFLEKSAELAVSVAPSLEVKEIVSEDPAFKVRLITDEPGKRFRIAITPVSLEMPAKGLIRLRFESPRGAERTAVVYAVIR